MPGMSSVTPTALAAAVRDTCAQVAVHAYEDAGTQGLCAEGRFEAAVGAIERVDVAAFVAAFVAARVRHDAALAQDGVGTQAAGTQAPSERAHANTYANEAAPTMRAAGRDDLPALAALLSGDAVGVQSGRPAAPLAGGYLRAFEAIERDPNCELLVACRAALVVGMLQLDFTPHLSPQGAWHATIDALRVAAAEGSRETGRAMIEWAIARARSRGCVTVKLGSDCQRDAAQHFERLGGVASPPGMTLDPGPVHPG